MQPVVVSEHIAADGAHYPDGTYRVVGTDACTITAVRVGDAEGRRVHTGEVVTIDRGELDGFTRAEAPGWRGVPRRNPRGRPRNNLLVRPCLFGRQLRTRPVPGAIAVALLVAGAVGDPVLPVSESVRDAMVLLGGLAAIGSGRL